MTTATKEPTTIGGQGLAIGLLFTAAVTAGFYYWTDGGPGLLLIAWPIGLFLLYRRGRRQRAVLNEADRLLAESRATDQQRRGELLARFAGDLHTVTDRRP